jgi:hypothetical protein
MRDQRSGVDDAGPVCVERALLGVLLFSEFGGPWSVVELERDLGGDVGVIAAIDALSAAGVVHRCEGFVWATRAAARAGWLASGP